MKPIDVAGFEAKFRASEDPWRTWTDRDEAVKRGAILHALGPTPVGRVLELGAGNGSNSVALARRSLQLDATEATSGGTALVAKALRGHPGTRALQLTVPALPPRTTYDAIVIAELLYYLDPRAMRTLARQVARLLRPGGRLVLAHHRITFYDFVQHADGIQRRFLDQTGARLTVVEGRRTGRWQVLGATIRG